jgi:uncharacterized protein (TIGR03083 family)
MSPDIGPAVSPPFVGPWPDGIVATRHELASYLADVADGSLDALATRCAPWSVREVTVHLAETFRRFHLMLEQGRRGDFAPPFASDELDSENLRAVEAFSGDPAEALTVAAAGFLDALDSLDEPVPHQAGTLPVGLQVLFGLMDIAMHHDDVLAAAGRRYRPSTEALAAIVPVAERLYGMPADQPDPWSLMLLGAGRDGFS